MTCRTRPLSSMALAVLVCALVAPGAAAQYVDEPGISWPTWEPPAAWASATLGTAAEEGAQLLDERTVAGLWSAFIPGAGQFYLGERGKGAVMLGGFAASIVYALTAGLEKGELCAGSGMQQSCTPGALTPNRHLAIGLGSASGFYIWSVLDAIAGRSP